MAQIHGEPTVHGPAPRPTPPTPPRYVEDLRVLLDVLPGDSLDPTDYTYLVDVIDDAGGKHLRLTEDCARRLMVSLHNRLHLAAEMKANPPRSVRTRVKA